MATLTVLMGPPGAGKTTWLETHHKPNQVVCSTERLKTDRAMSQPAQVAYIAALHTRATHALTNGQDVITDGCNTRRTDRTRWLHLAHHTGAHTHLVVLHTPLATLLDVQHTRPHPVPEHKVRAYHQQMARALRTLHLEGWGHIDHIHREPAEQPALDGRHWVTADQP